MKELLFGTINAPATGPSVTVSATILYWIGALTPYVAFIALVAGLALTIKSYHSRKLEDEVRLLEKRKLEAEIKALEQARN